MVHSLQTDCVQTVQRLLKPKDCSYCLNVVTLAHFVHTTGQSQKKDLSPDSFLYPIKHVDNVSIVNSCLFTYTVESTLNVAETVPVGGRVHNF